MKINIKPRLTNRKEAIINCRQSVFQWNIVTFTIKNDSILMGAIVYVTPDIIGGRI